MISKIREISMGIAIIWIMLFHMPGLSNIMPEPINFLINLGYMGVDIFFFLSAYGLFFSLEKGISIHRFYERRIIRILPTYYIVLLLFDIINNKDLTAILKEASLLGFYIPALHWKPFDWYIPALLIFYLVFPLIYKYKNFIKTYFIHIFCLIFISSACISNTLTCHNLDTIILFFITRIPIFLLGVIYAQKEKQNQPLNINIKFRILLIIIGLSFLYVIRLLSPLYYINLLGLQFYPLLLIVPNLLIILSYIKFPNTIIKILTFCGKYSLELYLIHWNLYRLRNLFQINRIDYLALYLILCFFISFPLAWLLNKCINMIRNFCNTRL